MLKNRGKLKWSKKFEHCYQICMSFIFVTFELNFWPLRFTRNSCYANFILHIVCSLFKLIFHTHIKRYPADDYDTSTHTHIWSAVLLFDKRTKFHRNEINSITKHQNRLSVFTMLVLCTLSMHIAQCYICCACTDAAAAACCYCSAHLWVHVCKMLSIRRQLTATIKPPTTCTYGSISGHCTRLMCTRHTKRRLFTFYPHLLQMCYETMLHSTNE